MKNIMVTGGAGFIGSNFIRHLLQTDPKVNVVNVDLLTYAGHIENLIDIPNYKRYLFYQYDICDGDRISSLMRRYQIDTVINFAAESHVDRSIESSQQFVRTNVVGTQVLLDCALNHGIGRFVQIGTDEVYGSLEKDSPSSIETDPLAPRSPYSASKASADLLALSYFHTHGLPICVTRSSNNYGTYQHPEKVIPLFITNVLGGKKVPMYGDGTNIRDWLHVRDNCEAIRLVAEKGTSGEIYNIASGNEIRNIDLTKMLLWGMGISEWGKHVEYVPDRKGHDWRYSMVCDKIREELGWVPKMAFDEGLKGTIEWYRVNVDWWKGLS